MSNKYVFKNSCRLIYSYNCLLLLGMKYVNIFAKFQTEIHMQGIWIFYIYLHKRKARNTGKETMVARKMSLNITHANTFEVDIIYLITNKFNFIKPARSAGFSRIKKIPYQAPPTQLGPRKCTF